MACGRVSGNVFSGYSSPEGDIMKNPFADRLSALISSRQGNHCIGKRVRYEAGPVSLISRKGGYSSKVTG